MFLSVTIMFLEGRRGLRPQVDSICLPCTPFFFSFQKALRVLQRTLKTLQAYYLLASLINCTLTSCQDAIRRCQRKTGQGSEAGICRIPDEDRDMAARPI